VPYRGDLDLSLIALLQEDGRRSTSEISRRLGVPESTVRRRIERLLESQVIRVVAVVEYPDTVGLPIHATFSLLVAPSDQKQVIEHLQACDEIRWIALTTGAMNLQAEGFFHSLDHLRGFYATQVTSLAEIQDSQFEIVLELYKNTFDWAAMIAAQPDPTRSGGSRDR